MTELGHESGGGSELRKQDETVHIPLNVAFFLAMMFGSDSTHGIAGDHSRKVWQRYCKKLVAHIHKYVDQNVLSDRAHLKEFKIALDQMDEAVRKGDLEVGLVIGLTRALLAALGGMPNHFDKKKVGMPHHFRLNDFRTLAYVRTPDQLAHALLQSLFASEALLADRREAAQKYSATLRRPMEFIDWYKERYPNDFAGFTL